MVIIDAHEQWHRGLDAAGESGNDAGCLAGGARFVQAELLELESVDRVGCCCHVWNCGRQARSCHDLAVMRHEVDARTARSGGDRAVLEAGWRESALGR